MCAPCTCRMVADGAVPNTKTFTALIGSFGKMGSVGAALDIITELLGHDQGVAASASTYAALMAACEKAGQGDLALALFEKMKAQVQLHASAPAIMSSLSLPGCGLMYQLLQSWLILLLITQKVQGERCDEVACCPCRTCSLMLPSSTP